MDEFRRKLLIYWGLILGSTVLFLAGGLWLAGSISAHAKEINLQRTLVTGRTKSLEVLARLKHNSRDVDTYGALMDRLLPEQESLINFPRWVELAGRTGQVGLTFAYKGTVTPSSPAAPGSIDFNLEASGTIEKLTQFVEELETKSSQYLVAFDSFDLTKRESEYRLVMTGKVFFR